MSSLLVYWTQIEQGLIGRKKKDVTVLELASSYSASTRGLPRSPPCRALLIGDRSRSLGQAAQLLEFQVKANLY